MKRARWIVMPARNVSLPLTLSCKGRHEGYRPVGERTHKLRHLPHPCAKLSKDCLNLDFAVVGQLDSPRNCSPRSPLINQIFFFPAVTHIYLVSSPGRGESYLNRCTTTVNMIEAPNVGRN